MRIRASSYRDCRDDMVQGPVKQKSKVLLSPLFRVPRVSVFTFSVLLCSLWLSGGTACLADFREFKAVPVHSDLGVKVTRIAEASLKDFPATDR